MVMSVGCSALRSVCGLLCFVFCLVLVGCGRSDLPELASVSGTIQMDGKPLADATLKFIPANGRPSTGRTDANGYFTMSYTEDADGVVPGECRVMISTGTAATENEDGEPVPGNPETVPAEYNVDTNLTFVVKPGSSNTADFELTGRGAKPAIRDGEDDAPGGRMVSERNSE